MGLCPDKPRPPTPSAQDIALARVATRDDNLRRELFNPIEQRAIAESTDPERLMLEKLLVQSAGNADIAQQAAANTRTAQETANAFARANGLPVMQAMAGQASAQEGVQARAGGLAQTNERERQLNVARTGRDMARTTATSLSALANNAQAMEQSRLQNKQMVQQARLGAITDIASSAGVAAYAKFGGNKKENPTPGSKASDYNPEAMQNFYTERGLGTLGLLGG